MKLKTFKGCVLLAAAVLLSNAQANAQTSTIGANTANRAITTAVPFLTIAPDARSSGMGDAGGALSADANAAFWNPARLAFNTKEWGGAISYTPWLRNLGLNDMFITHLAGYHKFRKDDAIGMSLTYFSLGSIAFTDQSGNPITDFRPNEFSLNVTYSRLLSDNLSLGLTGKFINSNLTGDISTGGSGGATALGDARPGRTAAVDLGLFYTKEVEVSGRPSSFNLAAVISNVGPKISYSDNNQRDFIPANLRLGGAFTYSVDEYNKITITADANKLLVPTPSVDTGSVINRRRTDVGLFQGMVQGLTEAPGGMNEKFEEIIYNVGFEYWYDDLFAVRAGYFYENPDKGNRQYFTFGIGVRYQTLGFDFSYLAPTSNSNSPLANTLRFGLHFDIASTKAAAAPAGGTAPVLSE